ncbi:MAG: amidohydrolase family protein [Bacteroidales bacterium]|nr:amidohydrolase family protein [Bacteroidales bacterium]MDD4671093.1 amidohydrolase family protein [Bacteroidales bacterium]
MKRRDFLKTTAIGAAALGIGFYGGRKIGVKQPFETIIKNGVIYTGDGKNPIKGDIGIRDGRIAAIGLLGDGADMVIDAKGLAVSPGFIDIHTHTDTNLFDAPKGDSRIFQGITTDIGGNCGDSPFPYSDAYYASKKDSMRHGYPFWQDIDGFYDALRKQGIGINYGSYVGQGQLRSAVIGDNNVPATQQTLKKMCDILDKEMEMGSIGISCGLEYAPSSYASDEEIVELCKVVARHNGLFAIHMRNEDDRVEESLSEAIAIARASGVRLEVSHLKAQNAANWHKAPHLLQMIDEARQSGLDIAFDRYPYVAFSTGLTSFIPLDDRQGSNADILARLTDPVKSEAIGTYAQSRIVRLGGPQNVLIAGCSLPENAKYSGKNLEECCNMSGMELWPMIKHLLVSEKLSVQMAGFAMKEDNLKMIFAHPLSMPASDGSVYSPEGVLGESIPHPRSYGTFPRFFEKYVREEKVCDLSTAIYKCTALPASRLLLKERGLLIPSYHADIVVFNPDTIADKSTYDKPHQFPEGIEHVFVNGVWTIKNGRHTGKLAGTIV